MKQESLNTGESQHSRDREAEAAAKVVKPRPRKATVTWVPVDGPVMCSGPNGCGHNHWGWKLVGSLLAPQWTWCDRVSCNCRGLKRLVIRAAAGVGEQGGQQ